MYMALQELKVLRAINCTGITGKLPSEYGLLNLDVLQLTNTALTGTLPAEWASPTTARKIAAAFARGTSYNIGLAGTGQAAAQQTAAHQVASRVRAAQAGGEAAGLQRLRVLGLSVADPGQGGLSGKFPNRFAAMKQLEVSRNRSWPFLSCAVRIMHMLQIFGVQTSRLQDAVTVANRHTGCETV
jgi:hypothetical protein